MMTKEGFTKIVNCMNPGAAIVDFYLFYDEAIECWNANMSPSDKTAAVAQWVRALAPQGWVFESQPRQT